MEMNLPRKKPRVSVVKVFFVFVILSLIAGISALGYLYFQTREELKFLSSPEGQQQLVKDETAQIVQVVSRYIILPEEEPILATITDASALASQSAFYKNAQNGDKLLVYQQAKQAFIYSPARNKLVNVGPILMDGSPVGEETNDATEPIKETEKEQDITTTPTPTTESDISEQN